MSWHGGGRRPVWHPIYYVYDSSCTVYAQLSLGLTWRMELLDYINLRVCCIQRHLVLSRLISPTPRVHASDLGFIFLPTVCCCCRRQPTATCKLSKRWRHAVPVLMYQMQYHKLSDLSSHSCTRLPVCDMISYDIAALPSIPEMRILPYKNLHASSLWCTAQTSFRNCRVFVFEYRILCPTDRLVVESFCAKSDAAAESHRLFCTVRMNYRY